jgi:hypothetical protein
MTYEDLRNLFNRALLRSFSRKKILLMFCILAFSGLLYVFFQSLAQPSSRWLKMSLTFMPLFLAAGVLLAGGVLLIRMYHDEIKGRKVGFRQTLGKSWEVVLGSFYFCIPVVLFYLLLWLFLGMFVLMSEIPLVGPFFYAFLAFLPFLLNLCSLLLAVFSLGLLFFIAPAVALKGLNGLKLSQWIVKRFKSDPFTNIFLAMIALFPLVLVLGLLIQAAAMSEKLAYQHPESPLYMAIQSFFIMLPFVAILSPVVVFFFNFAAESHVLIKRELSGH